MTLRHGYGHVPRWWETYANIVKLLVYLDDEQVYTKADMLEAVEKPWKYEPEAKRAGVEIEEDEG